MTADKKREKSRLHPRNRNRENYDFPALAETNPELAAYIRHNDFGCDSVDFSNPVAVRFLNKAILNYYYHICCWDLPGKNLCPAIPGRADYIHYAADLLIEHNCGKLPSGDRITCLDIGTGAGCIYPLIGVAEYGWSFIGTDTIQDSIDSAVRIVDLNPPLKGRISLRLQKNPDHYFYGIISTEDRIDLSLCNPPFHASAENARQGTLRKVRNLSGKKLKKPELNFSGLPEELVCEGGESRFIRCMINESRTFSGNFFWFTTLVSKQATLKGVYQALDKVEARQVRTIPMGTGNKITRIVAWTFLTREQQETWRETRWY